jgi:hypothetical protein
LAGLYRQALAALSAGEQEKAVELLVKIINLNPNYRETTRYLHLALKNEDVAELTKQVENLTKENTAHQ